MLWNAKNGCVKVGDTDMYYASFGKGSKALILLPGLSDGLATVKGKALILAKPYRIFFDKYTVYMFSRKNAMPDGYTIRDMAADQAVAMKALGIGKVCVTGVSQGGMIAQYLALDHPEAVKKLILAVTAPRVNDTIRNAVGGWIKMAEKGDHAALMADTAEKSYSDAYLEKYMKMLPLASKLTRPKDYRRFLINAKAILGFDAFDEIGNISCPTLIIGGDRDKTVGTEAAGELHSRISHSELYIYKGLGHAAYEEAEDFNKRLFDFFEKA